MPLQRLTGKTPDNLDELREMALEVDDDDDENDEDVDCQADAQGEDGVYDETQSDSEEEASDQDEAADDWHRLPFICSEMFYFSNLIFK